MVEEKRRVKEEEKVEILAKPSGFPRKAHSWRKEHHMLGMSVPDNAALNRHCSFSTAKVKMLMWKVDVE